ncbi:MAG: shikimate kinase [Synechococcales bacterium]|nr:shikimate kinase [Cyanobacteria bacterium REEB444]MEB3124282.1 shikimate kinase [Synechococcales bacterium]
MSYPDLTTLLNNVNIVLIGMMGAGKTTIGKLLSDQLGYRFLDTDAVIEKALGQSIYKLFNEIGEGQFRRIETQVIAQLSAHTRLTIATGGGIVVTPENWSYLHHGVVVWLDVPLPQLWDRLQRSERTKPSRPLLKGKDWQQQVGKLLEERTPLYAQADVRVGVTPQDTPDKVLNKVIIGVSTLIQSTLDERKGGYSRKEKENLELDPICPQDACPE